MAAAIIANQAGKPPGVAGQSRDDLDGGVLVDLTLQDDPGPPYAWTFLDVPLNSALTVLQDPTTNNAKFTPESTAYGTWLVKLIAGSGPGQVTLTLALAVKTPNLKKRLPAAFEKGQFGTKGWKPAVNAMLAALDERIGGFINSVQFASVTEPGPGGPDQITVGVATRPYSAIQLAIRTSKAVLTGTMTVRLKTQAGTQLTTTLTSALNGGVYRVVGFADVTINSGDLVSVEREEDGSYTHTGSGVATVDITVVLF